MLKKTYYRITKFKVLLDMMKKTFSACIFTVINFK